MAQVLGRPIYYVLGNHDFYRGSIAETRPRVERLSRQSRNLIYLSRSGVVQLTPDIALVGHDGWGDARLGDFEHSDIILNDYLLIEELYHWNSMFELDRDALRRSLETLGDEAARHLESLLPEALADARQVLVLTHVPPFREACWHANAISDDRWLPHFSCLALGQVLEAAMRSPWRSGNAGPLRPHARQRLGANPAQSPGAHRRGPICPPGRFAGVGVPLSRRGRKTGLECRKPPPAAFSAKLAAIPGRIPRLQKSP